MDRLLDSFLRTTTGVQGVIARRLGTDEVLLALGAVGVGQMWLTESDAELVLALADLQSVFRGVEGALSEARYDRNQALRAALRGGVSRDTVRQITGLSPSRISQILNHRSGHHGS